MNHADILEGYTDDATELIPRFEALETEAVLAPVLDLLPALPGKVLDIGAGTGRDSAWLAGRGHRVLAVEPVRALRRAGRALHLSPDIEWLDDSLPHLSKTLLRNEFFDLVLSVAVWQHLPPDQHGLAVTTIAPLIARGGRIILSIRHGPGAPNRPCFAADVDGLIAAAEATGLKLIARRSAASVQPRNRAAGVTWDWLCLEQKRAH